ncbi:venom carboxylesterase-6-like [Phlebotomus argentipes]|uniref:venom carboxylesterase-6-like n=1 Tax=Phlebotomus argentipes TaxID=94469 RepID=UPI002892E912|nr:venom carboxylesterase-6-like [Phlebotomus argentipes]
MHFKGGIFLCLLFGILAIESAKDEAIVELLNGPIRGVKLPNLYVFKGIQYGDSPVGEKRFESVGLFREKWTEVRNATEFGPKCIQLPHLGDPDKTEVVGEEDCLFLNVYTTSLDTEKNLPVFIHIHGGAFMYNTANNLDPERILQHQEAVFVLFNYRLGAMGFLSTEDEVVPGNMGLKDQVVALEWIKENIKAFGGNPDSVTITGLSAGGASTHLHYFSPLSSGLFHRGISQSGCALNPWVFAERSKKKAKIVAEKLDCPTGSVKEMIKCLKSKSAQDIVMSARLFQPWLYNPFSPFGVVVEKKGVRPFLTDHPEDLIRKGRVSDLPWIVSLTDSEGLYPVADLIDPPSKIEELNSRWEELAPAVLDYGGSVSRHDQPSVAKMLKKFYLNREDISEENFDKFVDMVSDRLFAAGISLSARLHAEYLKSPVYLMYFTFPAQYGVHHIYVPDHKFKGAGHGDDIFMIYKTAFRKTPLSGEEQQMVKLYSEIFTSFANGKPQMADLTMIPITNKLRMPFLHIKSPSDISIEITEGFGNEKFWYSLPIAEFAKYNAPKAPPKIEL